MDNVQFEHVISVPVNPVTALSKVPVIKKLVPVNVAHSVPVVSVTDGLTLSNVALAVAEISFGFPTAPTATPVNIVTVNAHCPLGVTVRW